MYAPPRYALAQHGSEAIASSSDAEAMIAFTENANPSEAFFVACAVDANEVPISLPLSLHAYLPHSVHAPPSFALAQHGSEAIASSSDAEAMIAFTENANPSEAFIVASAVDASEVPVSNPHSRHAYPSLSSHARSLLAHSLQEGAGLEIVLTVNA